MSSIHPRSEDPQRRGHKLFERSPGTAVQVVVRRPDGLTTAEVAAVAAELHVSTARVSAALQPLFAAGHADPSSPAFAAAARSLGVSSQQLSTALMHAKQSLAQANEQAAGAKPTDPVVACKDDGAL